MSIYLCNFFDVCVYPLGHLGFTPRATQVFPPLALHFRMYVFAPAPLFDPLEFLFPTGFPVVHFPLASQHLPESSHLTVSE